MITSALARQRWAEQGHTLQSFTYSQAELEKILRSVGFTQIEFYAAWPDYKLPTQIISLKDEGRPLHDWLQHQNPPAEHNGYDGSPLEARLQENLTALYRSLAADGLARNFVPSFFIRAS